MSSFPRYCAAIILYALEIAPKHPVIPYINNADVSVITQAAGIKDSLARQVYSPVKWQQTMEKMLADGVDIFYEIGPGKTLSGFMKRIDRSKKVITINTIEDLNAIC